MDEKPSPDIIEVGIDIVVALGGLALMLYLKANYAHDLGAWIVSFF
ncbi:hypothetical protein J1C56_02140 [Aminobacter anthyllidis]|uniref:Uncharacterized protein n=1 Tax=Aminobacter anthyllidis TaxID=1035067 RepID=A0A9X1A797_9HYPH|nr:hypothetical protein [Aminobacter anthyllidis]MBT1154385.1 hypothetical protein [Aminobacter anthyllidis]